MRAALLLLVVAPGALAPDTSAAQGQLGPCEDERALALLCPDLRMKPPYELRIDRRARPGRVLLRAASSIDSVGLGPVELVGMRDARLSMRVVQRIPRRGRGVLALPSSARLGLKRIPGQGVHWKVANAARFELWRLDANGARTKLTRTGPKVFYCFRDLRRTVGGRRSPSHEVYPACSRRRGERRVVLGTSVGWSDVYPASYHEQWVDVTGLRGRFELVHVADPLDGIEELDETNNAAGAVVRLPLRTRGRGRDEDYGWTGDAAAPWASARATRTAPSTGPTWPPPTRPPRSASTASSSAGKPRTCRWATASRGGGGARAGGRPRRRARRHARAEPFDVMESGRMAPASDPTGAVSALWQAREHASAAVVK